MYADIKGTYAQTHVQSAPGTDITNWTQPAAVAPGTGDQFGAEVSTAPNGRLDVMFNDRRYSGNQLVDVTYATSSNGGATWKSTRVSTAGFDPSHWGVPSGSSFRPFTGDYNGIASTNASAELTWTGVSSPAPYNLDIFAATVTP